MAAHDPIVVKGFGRQKVYPPVGRCIYCFATDCDLGDEHIIPQALGGNIVLRDACCPTCERIIGAGLEGILMHKTKGIFAAMRLRMDYKSKRPKDRPLSLPYTIISKDGVRKIVDVPAKMVPRHWTTYTTLTSPGVIIGRLPDAEANINVFEQYLENDFAKIASQGESVQFQTAIRARDFARFIAKIAHAITVAAYGLDAFEAWLPNFILNKDSCAFHYYVSGHENKSVDTKGDHSVSLGTWESDGLRIAATVRLFCRYATPSYMVAVGKFKEPHDL
jgi:hypothetical protein